MRLRLVRDAFDLMLPGAPFVQFTYSVASPVPKRLRRLFGGSVGAYLDEPASGAGLGLSQALTSHQSWPTPKILVMAGSLRTGSHNARLAALAAKEIALADARCDAISFADYTLPLFDPDLANEGGLPRRRDPARRMLGAHQGVFITSPEYSASVAPLIKNAIDWMSRGREGSEPSYAVFKGRVFALGAAANGAAGGVRWTDGDSANARTRLRRAGDSRTDRSRPRHQAFDDMDNLTDEALAESLKRACTPPRGNGKPDATCARDDWNEQRTLEPPRAPDRRARRVVR